MVGYEGQCSSGGPQFWAHQSSLTFEPATATQPAAPLPPVVLASGGVGLAGAALLAVAAAASGLRSLITPSP